MTYKLFCLSKTISEPKSLKGEKAITIFWCLLSQLKKLKLKFWKWQMKQNIPPFLKIPLTQFHKKLPKSFLSPCLLHVINVLDMNWLFYHSFHSKEPWFSLSLSVFSWKTLSLLLCPPNSGWWRLSREFSTDVPITFRPNGLQIYFDRSTTSLLFIFIGGKIKASLNGEI